MRQANVPVQVPGIRLGAAGAGIKRLDRDDILLIELAEGASCAAVFTRNAFCAAPVTVARDHLVASSPRWLLINSGNANAGTGERGLEDARETCRQVAELAGGQMPQVMPFSTGVIGEYLPVDKIFAALPVAKDALTEAGWERAARAIMTTDTRPKLARRTVNIQGHLIEIAGIAKGAGMIHPNMATMLSFIGTNAKIDGPSLQALLTVAVDRSFNCITIDGDTSTNDACVLMASGVTEAPVVASGSPDYAAFAAALQAVCDELAEAIVRDGEGATKFMRIIVEQAATDSEARNVGKTVAHSPLVKTAFFASDPNWGRILAAVGRSDCPDLDIGKVCIWLDDLCIVENGGRSSTYTETAGQTVMSQSDITIRVRLGRGVCTQQVLTCDFSYDYVRINAEYRT